MFKLKDKNGTILNVATKSTYHSLLSTGNYFKVLTEDKPKEIAQEDKTKENKTKK